MTQANTPMTVGVFCDGLPWADLWFHQCDGVNGQHRGIQLCPYDSSADHLILMGNMPPEIGGYTRAKFSRRIAKARGEQDAWILEQICNALDRNRDDLSMVVYEPNHAYTDAWFRVANERFSHVYAPDDRASDVITLPTTWSFQEGVSTLLNEKPQMDRPISLGCITSGKTMWPGHRDRLDFLSLLRTKNIDMNLTGMNLPSSLRGLGPVQSKGTVLRGTRFTLAIENEAENPHYVTEKIWDPLLAWSLPIYYGSEAVDSIIPKEAYIRLPDLGQAGVDTILETVSNPKLWEERLEAISEARKLILGENRLVELFRKIANPDSL